MVITGEAQNRVMLNIVRNWSSDYMWWLAEKHQEVAIWQYQRTKVWWNIPLYNVKKTI